MIWPSHGSNPQYLYKALGISLPQQYIDFSANINPLGPPAALKDRWNSFFQEIMVYPDPFGSKLTEQIAQREQITSDSILIGNGGAELITLTGRLLAGKTVLIVQPAFSEYEQACRANHCEVMYHQLSEPQFELNLDRLRSSLIKAQALFLCNPNNPTGIQIPKSTILSILEECEKAQCLVVLDEAFYDFLEDYHSLIPYIKRFSNLIIIRSMTKMFAIPGIRLGYMAAQPKMIEKFKKLQSHWSINSVALSTGELCLLEEPFIKESQAYIQNERIRLFQFFTNYEYKFSPSKVNFYLLQDPFTDDQLKLFQFLLNKGIIPRHTFNFPGLEGNWVRFAIKSFEENNLLMEVLAEWRKFHH